ncbi:jg2083 [Pararge aegeria aegeria]|uniref:Jg2083 protein n=1 Tax=Pararge aegeria aegeria TaxID=348720 RepID=A0A8S4SAJ3_9NEOP|nr:jg2083 [Pararge aegeria aegeria]
MSTPEDSLKRGLTNKCVSRETSSCIAIELVGYVDRMLRTAAFQLSDDLMIVDESNGAAAEIPIKSESLARAGTSLEDQAQQLIVDKLWNFATTRSFRYRLLDNADVVIAGKTENDGSLGVGMYFFFDSTDFVDLTADGAVCRFPQLENVCVMSMNVFQCLRV